MHTLKETMHNCSCILTVVFQVNETIMLSIVTDPETDYIFVTDFDVLAERQEIVRNQACRTVVPSTPSTSVTTPDFAESMLQLLHNLLFFTDLLKESVYTFISVYYNSRFMSSLPCLQNANFSELFLYCTNVVLHGCQVV